MLTTVTKHKKFEKNCWYEKNLLCVCCEKCWHTKFYRFAV